MGWTSCPRVPGQNDHAFVRQLITEMGLTIVAGAMRSSPSYSSTYYAAVHDGDESVFALVVLLDKSERGRIAYKDLPESVGPWEDEAPEKVLNALSPTDNEYALEWRQRCRDNLNAASALRERVDALTEGVVIEVSPDLMTPDGQRVSRLRYLGWKNDRLLWAALTADGKRSPCRLPDTWATDHDWTVVETPTPR